MRFAHVNHRYLPFVGGSERYVQEVSEHFAQRCQQVSVFTTNAYDLEYFWDRRFREVDAPRREIIDGVEVIRLPIHHVPLNSWLFHASRRSMGELSRIWKRTQPFQAIASRMPRVPGLEHELRRAGPFDVVHATNLGLEAPALMSARYAAGRDAALVLSPFIHLGRRDDLVARRYVTMPHQVRLLKQANLIFAMTEMEAEFIASLGVRPDRIAPVGVGIDPGEVTGGDGESFRRRHGITGFLVGSLGALAEDKGSPYLAQAVSALRRAGHDVALVLAGPPLSGFQRWYSRLDQRSREGIHVLGFVDPEEKRDMLDALDVMALPSRTESFGIVYLEGWANGKPVIAADAGAVVELVQDGVNGCLVPFGDSRILARRVLELAESPSLRASLGELGRSLTLARYTWPKVLDRVAAAHQSVLGVALPRDGNDG